MMWMFQLPLLNYDASAVASIADFIGNIDNYTALTVANDAAVIGTVVNHNSLTVASIVSKV